MHPLLRRLAAIAVTLSVMLSTLGVAHASCAAMAGMSTGAVATAHAMGDMSAMAGMSHDATAAGACEHGTPDPASRGHSADGCMLAMHCGATMLGSDAHVVIAAASAPVRLVAADDASPRALALEIDSRPPRA